MKTSEQSKSQRVLHAVQEAKRISAPNVAKVLDITIHQAHTELWDHVRAGRLIKRPQGRGHVYLPSIIGPVTKTVNVEQPTYTMPLQPHQKSTLNDLVNTMAKSFAEHIISRIEHHTNDLLAKHLSELEQTLTPPKSIEPLRVAGKPPAQAPVPEVKTKLPKVLVIGLLPQQCGQIVTEFCETFDLDFWNDRFGQGMEQLKAMAKKVEMTFIHIEHTSHKADELISSVGGNFIRVKGGLSQMRDALTEYYVKTAA